MKEFIEILREILSGGHKLDVSYVYQKYKDLRQISPKTYTDAKQQISRLVFEQEDRKRSGVHDFLQQNSRTFHRHYPQIEQGDLDKIKNYIFSICTQDGSATDTQAKIPQYTEVIHFLVEGLLQYLISQDDFDTFDRVLASFPKLPVESKNMLLLFVADKNHDASFVKSLLDHGAETNAPQSIRAMSSHIGDCIE